MIKQLQPTCRLCLLALAYKGCHTLLRDSVGKLLNIQQSISGRGVGKSSWVPQSLMYTEDQWLGHKHCLKVAKQSLGSPV